MMTLTDVEPRRSGARMLLAAAILLLLGNAAHPIDTAPSATSRFEFATAGSWVPIHLAVGIGMLLAAAGLVAFAGTIRGPGARAAKLGALSATVGGSALAIVFIALDGFAVSMLAGEWAAAAGDTRAAVEGAALALEAIDSGLAGFGTLLLLGCSLIAFGAAIRASRQVAVWLGWLALGIGFGGVVTGLALLVVGPTATSINWLLRPTATTATAYFVLLGVALRRPAPGTDPAAPARPARDVGGSASLSGAEPC
jgi:hypothetical protein